MVSGEAAQCLWLLQAHVGVTRTDLSVLPLHTSTKTTFSQILCFHVFFWVTGCLPQLSGIGRVLILTHITVSTLGSFRFSVILALCNLEKVAYCCFFTFFGVELDSLLLSSECAGISIG